MVCLGAKNQSKAVRSYTFPGLDFPVRLAKADFTLKVETFWSDAHKKAGAQTWAQF